MALGHHHAHHDDHDHGADGAVDMVHHHRDVQGGAARAAVFGVSDGLVSNVGLIIGVAATGLTGSSVVAAGVAGLLAGASSMAAGEYNSVKAQTELIERELKIERRSLLESPDEETRELTSIYVARGVDPDSAEAMASAVMADPEVALEVHAREELGVDPYETGDPLGSAVSSFVAFSIGAVIPLVPWFITEGAAAVIASIVLGIIAAAAVGVLLASFTERSKVRTAMRQVVLASAACGLTWLIGLLLGATII